MTRRSSLLIIFAAALTLGSSARAQDADPPADEGAPPPSAEAAPEPAAPEAAAPAPAEAAEEKPAPKPAAKPAPRRKAKAGPRKRIPLKHMRPGESKYKTRMLSESSEHTYRFDAEGNPVAPRSRKKTSVKAGPKAAEPAACSELTPCAPKNPDADAL